MLLFDKTKYDGVSSVREHIMKLMHYYNKLKDLKVEIFDLESPLVFAFPVWCYEDFLQHPKY
jgi:hypothetical protein